MFSCHEEKKNLKIVCGQKVLSLLTPATELANLIASPEGHLRKQGRISDDLCFFFEEVNDTFDTRKFFM
tara:strand:+ start:197 stop:403 length:207 start_codon:yes stop_codon:yes gene_type:complete